MWLSHRVRHPACFPGPCAWGEVRLFPLPRLQLCRHSPGFTPWGVPERHRDSWLLHPLPEQVRETALWACDGRRAGGRRRGGDRRGWGSGCMVAVAWVQLPRFTLAGAFWFPGVFLTHLIGGKS